MVKPNSRVKKSVSVNDTLMVVASQMHKIMLIMDVNICASPHDWNCYKAAV
jgi:hypothetical protein